MKTKALLPLLLMCGISVSAVADHHLKPQVYIIHAIPGQDLGLSPSLPVDVAVNGDCTLTGFEFGDVAGPLALDPDTYLIEIGVANSDGPCSNPAVISANVPFNPGEVAVVVAHLDADGTPTASKFLLDYSPADDLQSRINVFHAAAAPAVDIRFREKPCSHVGQNLLRGVTNGIQGTLVSPAKTWYLSISPAMQNDPLVGPMPLPIGLSKAYHLFAVGSLDQGSLTLLLYQSPLQLGAELELVSAKVTVIHGIQGQDLHLPPELPVDISLNGVPALPGFRSGEITPVLSLQPGHYHIKISPADLENPGSGAALIEADVVLNSGTNASVVAHLDEDAMPTASIFDNYNVSCHKFDHPAFVHHVAVAPAVDVVRTIQPFDKAFKVSTQIDDLMNGQQGLMEADYDKLWLKIRPAGSDSGSLLSQMLEIDPLRSPYVYVVGSLENKSLAFLNNELPRYQTLEALALHLNQSGPFAGQLDSLLSAVLAADPAILQALAGEDKITVFAPTDDAFAALGLTPETIPDQDPAFLTEVLLTHVLGGDLSADKVLAMNMLTTLQGSTLMQDNGVLTDLRGNQATIIVTDLKAGNGTIHVIDAVVLPPDPRPVLLDLAIDLNSDGPYADQFDALIAAVGAADPSIATALSGDDPLTVFAPTDEAFDLLGLNPDTIGDQDSAFLTEVLLTHVVGGKLLAMDVLSANRLMTLQGSDLLQDSGVLTDPRGREARIIVTDVEAANGVIHVIDAVVLPPEPLPNLLDLAIAVNSEGQYAGLFDTLIAAVGAADPSIAAALSGDDLLTVFAPTDEAFDLLSLNPDAIGDQDPAFLTEVLLTHVVGGKLMAVDVLAADRLMTLQGSDLMQDNGILTDPRGREARIVVTDVEAANGVIHVIDAVVLPPEPLPNLLDLAIAANSEGQYAGLFDTLIATVGAADPSIAAALSGDDPLTVFAPTDEAFAALDLNPENIDSLGQALLTDILLYHVSAGKQLAADVLAKTEIMMLKGGNLGQNAGVLTDNLGGTAEIIVTNVEAANGVIHVINAVVLPVAP